MFAAYTIIAAALAILLSLNGADAQTQRCWMQVEPPTMCGGSALSGTRVLKLPPWAPVPTDLISAQIFHGSGSSGSNQWQLVVDRGGAYTRSTSYPATQTCSLADGRPPRQCHEGNQVIAQLEYQPGWTHLGKVHYYSPPLRIYANDKILFDALCTGGPTNIVWRLCWIDGAGPAPISPPATWATAWSANPTTSNPAARVSVRNILPSSVGGAKVRVTFRAGSGGYYNLRYASIGVWNGNQADMVADPIELTFGGLSGFGVAPGGEIVSDPVSLSITSGQSFVVITDNDDDSNDAIGSVGTSAIYFLQQSTYALRAPRVGQGIVSGTDANVHGVVKIEVGN